MTDNRLVKMADVIARHSLDLQPGELALLACEPAGYPLVREVYRAALGLGACPYVQTLYPELDELLLKHGSDEQVSFVSEMSRLEIEQIRARLVVRAGENAGTLSGVSPERMTMHRRARQQLFGRMLERKARKELKVCLTQYPTNGAAQEAGMSLADYEEFVFHACFIDKDDPIGTWRALSADQQRHADFLETVRRVRIEGPDTELELSIAGRKWVNSDGKANFPSGEVFTGPVEDSANGRISFDIPAMYLGHPVEGVRLEFESGRVVGATAVRGQETLEQALGTDDGARQLGEFAFGLNYGITRATRNILFDEKIGGTIHLALGAGYPETGSTNKSAIHWDMIKDMKAGRVYADGKPVYENSRFKV